jgi:hypothetical protein
LWKATPDLVKALLLFWQLQGLLDLAGYLHFDARRCFMSYKVLQPSPLSTRGTHMKILIEGPWSAPLANSADARFLRSWLVYDLEVDGGSDAATAEFNWNAIVGLAVVVGISASFWAGVGITFSHLLK